MRKFCVLTTGRAGSTALMNALAELDDVAMPGEEGDGGGAELVHPRQASRYASMLSARLGRAIRTVPELVDAWFEANANAAFAGFKTMPNRHPDLERFIQQPDIQFITLVREDLSATVASFMAAQQHDAWLRKGGTPDFRWTFGPEQHERVAASVRYVSQGQAILGQVPDPIALTYEDLCTPGFRNQALDAFFRSHVEIRNPRPPTDASLYVENFDALVDFIDRELARAGRA
jgi:hypothetical protein